jgi:hypothetical protein
VGSWYAPVAWKLFSELSGASVMRPRLEALVESLIRTGLSAMSWFRSLLKNDAR